MSTTPIQATFVGYGGTPCTLFSAYDQTRRILVIAKEAKYRTERHENCVVLTNDTVIARDSLFGDDDLMEAIAAFYTLKQGVADDGRTARLTFADSAQRANPEGAIDRDGIEVHGPRYRVNENVSCAQIAALATCLYAIKAETVEQTIDMAEQLTALLCGDVMTI